MLKNPLFLHGVAHGHQHNIGVGGVDSGNHLFGIAPLLITIAGADHLYIKILLQGIRGPLRNTGFTAE